MYYYVNDRVKYNYRFYDILAVDTHENRFCEIKYTMLKLSCGWINSIDLGDCNG